MIFLTRFPRHSSLRFSFLCSRWLSLFIIDWCLTNESRSFHFVALSHYGNQWPACPLTNVQTTKTNQVTQLGRTPLRDADRRKISTTVAPRTDPTTSRTVSRYDANFRSRQRPRTKDRPTVNATTRPRRPPVIDYDYYEDEVPIVVGKSVLNSKLFLTSKGTIRCLDQGNFPHPYSCKKFITCARMVNGQVIGTEYTCPDKLSFDPIGGICNWSAGLGCKD